MSQEHLPFVRLVAVAMRNPGQVCALGQEDQALFAAIEIDDAKEVLALLKRGANTNARDEQGMTPAMWALLRGHRESLGVLMAAGLDHSVKDNHGQSIFDYFPQFGSLSNERIANASCVIASLTIDDVMASSRRTDLAECPPLCKSAPSLPR